MEHSVEHTYIDTGTIPLHRSVRAMCMEAAMKGRIASIRFKIVNRPASKVCEVNINSMTLIF